MVSSHKEITEEDVRHFDEIYKEAPRVNIVEVVPSPHISQDLSMTNTKIT